MRTNLNVDKFLAIYITISLHRSELRVASEGVVSVRFLEWFVRRDGSANAGRGKKEMTRRGHPLCFFLTLVQPLFGCSTEWIDPKTQKKACYANYNKRHKCWDTFPFKESRTNPYPPPPQTMLFSYRQLFLFPLPTLKEGGGGKRGVQVQNVTLRWFFPNCCLPSSVSQLFLSLIVAEWCCVIRQDYCKLRDFIWSVCLSSKRQPNVRLGEVRCVWGSATDGKIFTRPFCLQIVLSRQNYSLKNIYYLPMKLFFEKSWLKPYQRPAVLSVPGCART